MKILFFFILLTFFSVPLSTGDSKGSKRDNKNSGHVQMLMMMEAEELAEEMLMQNSPSTEETSNTSEDTPNPDTEKQTTQPSQQ